MELAVRIVFFGWFSFCFVLFSFSLIAVYANIVSSYKNINWLFNFISFLFLWLVWSLEIVWRTKNCSAASIGKVALNWCLHSDYFPSGRVRFLGLQLLILSTVAAESIRITSWVCRRKGRWKLGLIFRKSSSPSTLLDL